MEASSTSCNHKTTCVSVRFVPQTSYKTRGSTVCEDVTGSGEGVQWATDGGVGVRLNAAVPYWGQMASIHMIPHAGMSPL